MYYQKMWNELGKACFCEFVSSAACVCEGREHVSNNETSENSNTAAYSESLILS